MMEVLSTFEIAMQERFLTELGAAPKAVRNRLHESLDFLRSHANQHSPPRVKRLRGYKNLWRLRINDSYRLVYAIDTDREMVTCLMLGDRQNIYDRLGADVDGTPGFPVIANCPEILDPKPSEAMIGRALVNAPPAETPAGSEPLPRALTLEWLEHIGVPETYRRCLAQVTNVDELLGGGGGIPQEIVAIVLDALYPAPIASVINRPARLLPRDNGSEGLGESPQSLESFLLVLDDKQRDFVRKTAVAPGPWLLKGGPGSGKSTVALYCIREIVDKAHIAAALGQSMPRILFATYTRALTNAATLLWRHLPSNAKDCVHITTVDRLAWSTQPGPWQLRHSISNTDATLHMVKALSELVPQPTSTLFSPSNSHYLVEEVEAVIVGQGIDSEEDYLNAERPGRRIAMGEAQRRQMWQLAVSFREKLRRAGKCLFIERVGAALTSILPEYDYVFIDEAQDLRPVAVRLCLAAAKDKKRVFITADVNQSIYGKAMSWTTIAADLRFSGRATTLRKNYRTTSDIWQALRPLAAKMPDSDEDTLNAEPEFEGDPPVLCRHSSSRDCVARIEEFLRTSLYEERVGAGCAAVLCPTNFQATVLARSLDRKWNAKAMASADVDLAHDGVKVMTIHASKGLQFPVVVVAGVDRGKLPHAADGDIDDARRLLFVGCTRAARRLMVCSDATNPSPLIEELDQAAWDCW
jgi:mRNA-degrading endonuclease RelE of RelBE toxin-antitoxin system